MVLTRHLLPVVALSLSLVPAEAEACDTDSCYMADLWTSLGPVNAALIPTDGVLVLHGTGHAVPANWVDKLELSVTLDGAPVAGALEAPGIAGTLVWRPAAALLPGMYAVAGTVDNPDDLDYCAPDLDLDFTFMVDTGPAAPLTPPEVAPEAVVTVTEARSLDALACCEGVIPTENFDSCGGGDIEYDEGTCAPTEATGTLAVTLSIAPKLPIATVGLLAYSLLVDGEGVQRSLSPSLSHSDTKLFCTQVEAINLATGETVKGVMTCHDADEQAGQVGPQALDPTQALSCSPIQTCGLDPDGEAWDPDNCAPWSPEGETATPTEGSDTNATGSEGSGSDDAGMLDDGKGCACDGGRAGGSWDALAWLAVGLALRRRRRGVPGR